MAVNACEENQEAYAILVSPDEGTKDLIQSRICLDPQMKHENKVSVPMGKIEAFPHCIMDMDIGNGDTRMLRNNSDNVEKLKIEEMIKNESPLMKVLQRQISLPVGEKLFQLLTSDRFVLPKFNCTDKSASEKLHETPTYRSRKYKRSASFSSRKVVFMFSLLSSLGTLVLIYLTLRVRQMGDNYLGT